MPAVLEAYEDRMRRRALPTGRPCPAWRGAWGCREPRSTKSPRRAKARRGFADSGPDRSRQRGGGDIPPQETEDAFCHQGQKGAARRRADAKPRAGGAGKHADEHCRQSVHGRAGHPPGMAAALPAARPADRPASRPNRRQRRPQKREARWMWLRPGPGARRTAGQTPVRPAPGHPEAGRESTEAAFCGTSLSIKTRRSARRGSHPAVQPMRRVRRLYE